MTDLEKTLQKHFEDDRKNFKQISEDLTEIKKFMTNLDGVNDFFAGADLLKKPLMVVVAFVIGLVALVGAVKALIGYLTFLR